MNGKRGARIASPRARHLAGGAFGGRGRQALAAGAAPAGAAPGMSA
jgi:hypothetical protein